MTLRYLESNIIVPLLIMSCANSMTKVWFMGPLYIAQVDQMPPRNSSSAGMSRGFGMWRLMTSLCTAFTSLPWQIS